MKRLVICCDGTWNRLDAPYPTNVVKFAESVAPRGADGAEQIVFYDEGVGTGGAVARNVEKLWGGAFGEGLMRNVEDAYRFLIFNYEPGDEIFVTGFSRGAYTARSLVGMVRNCGILRRKDAGKVGKATALYRGRDKDSKPDSDKACAFRHEFSPSIYLSDYEFNWRKCKPGFNEASCQRLRIAYVGIWDTVGALGVPNHWAAAGLFNKKYDFHDRALSSSVRSARHAIAIDERRQIFDATLWENLDTLNEALEADPDGALPYLQHWFPGDHGSVGGGGNERGLSDDAFAWIVEGARKAGLAFTGDACAAVNKLRCDHRAPLTNVSTTQGFNILSLASKKDREGPQQSSCVSASARKRVCEKADALPEKELYRPQTLSHVLDTLIAACGPLRND